MIDLIGDDLCSVIVTIMRARASIVDGIEVGFRSSWVDLCGQGPALKQFRIQLEMCLLDM